MSAEIYTTSPLITGAVLAAGGSWLAAKTGSGCLQGGGLGLFWFGMASNAFGIVSCGRYFGYNRAFTVIAGISGVLLSIALVALRGGAHPVLWWAVAGSIAAQFAAALPAAFRNVSLS